MKTFIVLFLGLITSFYGFAQTDPEREIIKQNTDVEGLRKLAKNAHKQYLDDLEKFRRMQFQFRSNANDSIMSAFSGFDSDGKPMFNSPLDVGSAHFIKADALYPGKDLGLHIQGENMIAGVFDLPDVQIDHPAFGGRVTKKDGAFISTNASRHATGVAGIIAASGEWDAYYNGQSQGKPIGIAPKSSIWSYANGSLQFTNTANAAAAGLLVSNHSYGSCTIYPHGDCNKYYNSSSAMYDQTMYQAPYYVSVFAQGNGGPYPFEMSNLAISKNGISVANSQRGTNYTGPGSVHLYYNSSFGPTADLRIKPDITAVGQDVFTLGEEDGFIYGNGTSFSAPQITGSILLLQQLYNKVNGKYLRGATAKGTLLATAAEAGNYPGPDIAFGWGLADVKSAATRILEDGAASSISENTLENNGTFQKELIAAGGTPLIATVTWADPAGIPDSINNNSKLINNLDLRVTGGSSTFFPWKLDSATYTHTAQGEYLAAIKGDNNRDNVEKIEIASPVAGQSYFLNVNHKGSLTGGNQKFSLVISGLEGCISSKTIDTDVPANSSDKAKATNSIFASNRLNANSDVIYHAGSEVVLTDGFTADVTSKFRAYIESCSSDYGARRGQETVALLDDIPNEININIFPNPTSGAVSVDVSRLYNGGVLNVLSISGKSIYSQTFKSSKAVEIDLRKVASGVYIIRVDSDNKSFSKQFVKQ